MVSTLISPVVQERYEAVLATVAAFDIVIEVASKAVMVEPVGIPAPCIAAPILHVDVFETAVTILEPTVLVPEAAYIPIISFPKGEIAFVVPLTPLDVDVVVEKEAHPFVLILIVVYATPLNVNEKGKATPV